MDNCQMLVMDEVSLAERKIICYNYYCDKLLITDYNSKETNFSVISFNWPLLQYTSVIPIN